MVTVDADDGTVGALVAEHGRALARLAYLLTGDPGRAEDLVQDTFAQAVRYADRVTAAEHPRAYLKRIMTSQLARHHRRGRVDEIGGLDLEAYAGTDDAYDPTERDAMWRALAELSERQRAVLVLRYYEHLDDADIATHLGCRRATVRSLAARGLAALRDNDHLSPRPGRGPDHG